MKKNEIQIISEGNDWKLSSLLQHVAKITPNAVGILDHKTEEIAWVKRVDFNKVLEQNNTEDHLTFRIYRKTTVRGNNLLCMDIMHW